MTGPRSASVQVDRHALVALHVDGGVVKCGRTEAATCIAAETVGLDGNAGRVGAKFAVVIRVMKDRQRVAPRRQICIHEGHVAARHAIERGNVSADGGWQGF